LSYTPAKGTMKIGKAAGGVKFCFQFYLKHAGQRFRWHARDSLPVMGINRRSSRIAFNGMDTGQPGWGERSKAVKIKAINGGNKAGNH